MNLLNEQVLCCQVEERIPVEVCKRQASNQNTITLSRGEVTRKEGERRRTPSFRSGSTDSAWLHHFLRQFFVIFSCPSKTKVRKAVKKPCGGGSCFNLKAFGCNIYNPYCLYFKMNTRQLDLLLFPNKSDFGTKHNFF